jgi:hypothetical protein
MSIDGSNRMTATVAEAPSLDDDSLDYSPNPLDNGKPRATGGRKATGLPESAGLSEGGPP